MTVQTTIKSKLCNGQRARADVTVDGDWAIEQVHRFNGMWADGKLLHSATFDARNLGAAQHDKDKLGEYARVMLASVLRQNGLKPSAYETF